MAAIVNLGGKRQRVHREVGEGQPLTLQGFTFTKILRESSWGREVEGKRLGLIIFD